MITEKKVVRIEEDPDIIWEEFTSKNGNPFHVGHRKSETKKGSDSLSAKKDFQVDVNWPPSKDDKWKTTDSDFLRTTGITRYNVYGPRVSFKVYSYYLEFTNVENYDYYFVDATGDQYNVNCFSRSNHYVQYNSSNPTIVRVIGS
ncbi:MULTISPECIES: SH2 domain-containing protein [Pseudoalteromonas]|jgi:hypothetical protein|uniref:hypothetical protein n=1 Tax=Pseudoalteromonas TaxID=53246 RepID=UPI0018692312|nr:hypothetical protein [Pseudoalteromonas aliena]